MNISTVRGNYFNGGGQLYAGAHSGYYNAMDCYEANNYILQQFEEADIKGVDEMDLYVPWILSQEEWMGQRVSKTLYRHGVIRKEIKVNTILMSND